MHYPVDLIGSHTRFCGSGSNIKNLPREPTALSHCILAGLIQDFDLVSIQQRTGVFGITILPPYGVWNGLWQRTMGRQRVDRSKFAGEREIWKRVVGSGGCESDCEKSPLILSRNESVH